jgi:hypothetical protein
MIGRFSRRHSSDNIEDLLRRYRPEPNEELVTRLAARSRISASRLGRPFRLALAAALGIFLLVPLAAFGSAADEAVSAGKSAVSAVTRVSKPNEVRVIERSAAAVQYGDDDDNGEDEEENGEEEEIESESTPPVTVAGEQDEEEIVAAAGDEAETLPTTGLSLWLPVFGGLALLLAGVLLLRRGRPSER